MTNHERNVRQESAVNALQEATLLAGYLRRTMDANLTDLTKLHAALERARMALLDGKDVTV